MTNKIEKNFTLGGSLETALSGQYELKTIDVLKEAWKHTVKNFVAFFPAIIILLVVQLAIFYVALKLQINDLSVLLDMFQNPESFDSSIISAIFVANFSYEVISAPIFAGVSLMAMSHIAGLKTKTSHIVKGLSFTIPLITATLISLAIQGFAGMLIPLLSMYFSIAFSNATLLICEKHLTPLKSLLLSFRAVNKKIFPLVSLYFIVTALLFLSAIFYGFLLVITLPFMFHVKGIIYRNMFGISLKVISVKSGDSDDQNGDTADQYNESNKQNNDKESDVFDA
ncbi:hypothetical protein R3X26_07980 [Vibrio sp. TH_r3]|uniref:hypothetical protein n=1 Tax=Vibrio sp. TH_r3 TaxID=3082084 RepID=UPI002954F3B3|nr:hypothetical protein [Vibrio sp. TH_r3]MDV7104344.1 hypothetical protein [Vibrio sp. TH_r3]